MSLTPRENEIVKFVADGKTVGEIAQLLGISPHTVDTTKQNIYGKLKINGIALLTRYAIRAGLIEP